MENASNFISIDGILLEKEFALNSFFVENIFKNRFLNATYNSFHLFITQTFQQDYPEYQAAYNKAINLLDLEDQIITDTMLYLYKNKQTFSLDENNISDFHIEQLEKGYEFIVNQIKEY